LLFIPDNELFPPEKQTEHHKKLLQFCRGADVLIHDAQHTPQEMETQKGWGHSDYESAIQLAAAAKVKRLFLFHHDPFRMDEDMDRMTADAKAFAGKLTADLVVEAAKEGDTFVL
jgi:ribonuclease BN (tRNA processing enzyme)